MYIHKLKIGNVELNNNILLAPMAGITDKPFRKMTEEYSKPGLVYTEMVSSKAIYYEDEKTKTLVNTENESPIAIQIFGSEPEIMAQAAKNLQNRADIIDINMGCPAPKVVKNGDGSKLLLDLDLVGQIVKAVVKSVNIPVTVKLRKGWNNSNVVAKEAAKIIELSGASAITIHGRTREEYYSGQVDLDEIKEVKKAVNIPVIGNGDIKTAKDAQKMFDYTGVDGVMIGRATLGNPWVIGQIRNELIDIENGTLRAVETQSSVHVSASNFPSLQERLEAIKKHIDLALLEKGDYIGIREMRKHISWYIKSLKDSSQIREKINRLETKQEVIDCLNEYFKKL